MANKHTPAPWRFDSPEDAHVTSEDYHIVRGGCGFLAEAKDQRQPGFSISGHMTVADARLIAAAPELLAALQEMLSAQMAPAPSYEDGKDAQNAWADRRAQARNNAAFIIAKATGSAA